MKIYLFAITALLMLFGCREEELTVQNNSVPITEISKSDKLKVVDSTQFSTPCVSENTSNVVDIDEDPKNPPRK